MNKNGYLMKTNSGNPQRRSESNSV